MKKPIENFVLLNVKQLNSILKTLFSMKLQITQLTKIIKDLKGEKK